MTLNARMIALSVAGLLGSGCGSHPAKVNNGGTAAGAGEKIAKVMCEGINECRGKGDCAAGNCAGTNSCKGKGWLSVTQADCDQKGGKVAATKPAPAPDASAPAASPK
jgi:hypothetical protein